MSPSVEKAIEELRAQFSGHAVEVRDDGQQGAFVKVHGLPLGPAYTPETTWVAFRITFQYPHADIYPHYLAAGLSRKDGRPLGEAFHINHTWQNGLVGEPAIMVSRRSNRLNPATDTCAFKLSKVLDWIRSR